MSFVTLTWAGWMFGTTAAYWATPERWRARLLIAITLAFLLVYAPVSAVVLGASTLLCWWSARGAARLEGRVAVAVGSVLVAAFLGFRVLDGLGERGTFVTGVLVPFGMAYYLLRCLHYLLERYKGTLPAHGIEDLVAYLFFLPTLVVGPIHRFEPFLRDRRRHRWDADVASGGLERIVFGYAKIVIVANFLLGEVALSRMAGLEADWPRLSAWLEIVRYAWVLYAQFSGYSDVAIGFARLLGYRVMENFDWPFLKPNLSEFWASWHISLTSFVRDNVYMLVIALSRRPALAALASMVAMGLWHELSWRYLLWGVYHGAGIAVWQGWRKWIWPRLPAAEGPIARPFAYGASVLLTFHFVAVGFTLVAGEDTTASWALLRRLLLP